MKMFSLLAAVVMFSGVAVANAADPVALTDTQLESITAGAAGAVANSKADAVGVSVASTFTDTVARAEFRAATTTAPAASIASSSSRAEAVAG